MAALVVQSRFAGLVIEDDIEDQPPQAQKSKKAKPKAAAGAAKKPEANGKKANTGNKAPAAGPSKKKKSKGNQKPAEQWEQWRQKDEQLVDGHYEDELQQAILLSKLDFEQKKDVYKLFKKEAETQKKDQDKAGKKQKKKNVMSLDQFNDMVSGEEPKINHVNEKDPTDTPKSPDKDTEFFERVKDETKNELLKDKINDRVRNCKPLSNEIITRVQYAEALEKKDKEIADLHEEITVLRTELFTVKSRNKKLCNILGQGEMKDKAEVLIEVERLRGVQGELTAELAALHTELEKSRSKNQDHRSKDNKKKKGANGEKEK